MSLADQAPSARLHFLVAALLDESPPPTGLHRQEAESAQADARSEILARPRGKLRIVTDPPGARVLVDGREVPGTTPLEADVRLGDHFVTIQRFRYEPNTEQRFLQPFGLVRVNLEPARRSTLSDQLAAVSSGRLPAPPPDELRLAQAVWSRAEQVLTVSRDEGAMGGYRMLLAEGATGKVVRSTMVTPQADNALLRHAVCDVLGETCEVSRGIPWYVWPLAGAVVLGGVITTAVILENNRDTRFLSAGRVVASRLNRVTLPGSRKTLPRDGYVELAFVTHERPFRVTIDLRLDAVEEGGRERVDLQLALAVNPLPPELALEQLGIVLGDDDHPRGGLARLVQALGRGDPTSIQT